MGSQRWVLGGQWVSFLIRPKLKKCLANVHLSSMERLRHLSTLDVVGAVAFTRVMAIQPLRTFVRSPTAQAELARPTIHKSKKQCANLMGPWQCQTKVQM